MTKLREIFWGLGLMILVLMVAILARRFLLGDLGTRIVWVTFYPAVVSLDTNRIAGAIRSVTEWDAALGGVLENHAGRFQYTIIMQALQTGHRNA